MKTERDEKSQDPEANRLLTQAEMAEVLGVGTRTVRRLTQDGTIPCVQVGGRRPRYLRHEVIAALRGGANQKGDGR